MHLQAATYRTLRMLLTFLLVTLTPLLPLSRALAQNRSMATVDVPFDFLASSGRLPAGRYQLVQVHSNVVLFRSTDGRASRAVVVNSPMIAARPQTGRLIFRRYGQRYFLADLWLPGVNGGLHFSQAPAEKEMLRALEAPAAPPSTVQIAMLTAEFSR